jgi:hypothetical protein
MLQTPHIESHFKRHDCAGGIWADELLKDVESFWREGQLLIFVASEGRLAGVLGVTDRAIEQLHQQGIHIGGIEGSHLFLQLIVIDYWQSPCNLRFINYYFQFFPRVIREIRGYNRSLRFGRDDKKPCPLVFIRGLFK